MINYITMGNDCSTASTLRNLGLRKYTLPFDWVVSSKDSLSNCIKDDFRLYHKNLKNVVHLSKILYFVHVTFQS